MKTSRARHARAILRQLIERYALMFGEAQWTNGYRCSATKGAADGPENQRLYDNEMKLWQRVGERQRAVERALRTYTKAIRDEMRQKK